MLEKGGEASKSGSKMLVRDLQGSSWEKKRIENKRPGRAHSAGGTARGEVTYWDGDLPVRELLWTLFQRNETV